MTTPRPKRRRFLQFSLRTLLVFVLLVSVGMSWLAVKLEKARRQKEAVEAIEKAGLLVFYELQTEEISLPSPAPKWARALFGDDLVCDVVAVWVAEIPSPGDFGDDEAIYLKRLAKLRLLDLRGTQITDKGLENLKEMTDLWELDLRLTQVTPEGVKKLQEALPECWILHGD